MKLSSFSIIIFFTVLIIIGIVLLPFISLQLNPSNKISEITVKYFWHNATSRVIEQEVTSKYEGVFNTMRGIKNISSVSSKNYGSISIEFDKTVDIDNARFELASLVRQVYAKLPEHVSYPTITVNSPNENEEKALLTYTLNASASPYRIQEFAEKNIKNKLSLINGIDRIKIYGATPLQWEIGFDNNILQNLNISITELRQGIDNYFAKETLGFGTEKNGENILTTYVILKNELSEQINWKNIVIKKTGNRIIYLTDICTIREVESEPSSYYRINGKNSINIVIYPDKNVNNIVLSKRIKNKITELRNNLPANYFLLISEDSSEYLSNELQKIAKRTLYTIIILLLFVLLISRKVKYLLLILISLLANLSIAVIFYYLLKIEIHLYSLAGITVSLGLIIDNSIVMIDHIKHKNNIKVFLPILASSLTTIASLIIIFFLDEKIRLNLIDFAYVIIINLFVSLLIALFFIPALAHKIGIYKTTTYKKILFFKNKNNIFRKNYIKVLITNFYERVIKFLNRFKVIAIIFIILLFGIPVHKLPSRIENPNLPDRIYNNIFGSEIFIEHIKPTLNKILGGSFRLFNLYVFEGSYYSKSEETKLNVVAQLPQGTPIAQTNVLIKYLENYLLEFPEISRFVTHIYNNRTGFISIYFKPQYTNTSFPIVLKAKLINRALNRDGATWNIYGVGKGFDNYKGGQLPHYGVAIYGYNYDELNSINNIFRNKLTEHPRIEKTTTTAYRNIFERKENEYEYVMTLDNEKITNSELSPISIFENLTNITHTNYNNLFFMINKKYISIKLQSVQAETFDVWNLKNYPLKINNNSVKLKNFVEINKLKTGEDIIKINQEYRRFIEFDYSGTQKFGNEYLSEQLLEMQTIFPIGYYAKKQKNNLHIISMEESGKQPYWLLFLVALIIYFICAISFESLTQPFAVIFMIPISFIGVFLTFYLFDLNFDQGGYASFVLLSGLTVNSALYIINDYNNLKKKCFTKKINQIKLFVKAFNNKIVPIFITILSTILGLIPFILFAQNDVFWFALASGTIGGLIFSLIAIIFYLPIFIQTK